MRLCLFVCVANFRLTGNGEMLLARKMLLVLVLLLVSMSRQLLHPESLLIDLILLLLLALQVLLVLLLKVSEVKLKLLTK